MYSMARAVYSCTAREENGVPSSPSRVELLGNGSSRAARHEILRPGYVVLLVIIQEPRSESNAFDESASRGLRAVCALSQPTGKAMSASSARGRVLVPGQLGGMVVVTLVPRRHAGRAAWWSSAPGSCSACAKKSCHVQRHMAALRSAHMGSATQIHSSGTETKLVGHMARYGKLVIKIGPSLGSEPLSSPLAVAPRAHLAS